MTNPLTDRIGRLADAAELEGLVVDGAPGGAVHQWVVTNVACTPSQRFFVVFLLTAELADREARRQGFKNQLDRATARMQEVR